MNYSFTSLSYTANKFVNLSLTLSMSGARALWLTAHDRNPMVRDKQNLYKHKLNECSGSEWILDPFIPQISTLDGCNSSKRSKQTNTFE